MKQYIKGLLGWWYWKCNNRIGQLRFDTYDDYLASIDPPGQVKEMVALQERTMKRQWPAVSQIQGALNQVPEMMELAAMENGEDRWRHFAALAKTTVGTPNLASTV